MNGVQARPSDALAGPVAATLGRLGSRLGEAVDRNYRYAGANLPQIALFGVLGFPGFYVAWQLLDPASIDHLGLRVLGAALCVPGLLRNQIERAGHARILARYYCIAAAYCLPFFFCFALLENANAAADVGATPIQWPMQYAVALILLVLLFPSGLLAGIMFLLATLLAWTAFVVTADTIFYPEIERLFVRLLPFYLFIIAAGTLFNRNREVIDQEKLAAVASVGSTIAHELRTPFLGIKALTQGIQNHLPDLVDGYRQARDAGLPVKRIRGRHLDRLAQALARIEQETDYSNATINMLLINAAEQPLQGLSTERLSARQCVRDALQRYPFPTPGERAMVQTELAADFEFDAPGVLVAHVLFNLLKNAIYYVHKAGGGRIRICTRADAAGNRILVEDDGTGIEPAIRDRIFERFFTTTATGQGSGIGLSFSKMVMEGIGGAIECDSQPGRFTRFTLRFAPVRELDTPS